MFFLFVYTLYPKSLDPFYVANLLYINGRDEDPDSSIFSYTDPLLFSSDPDPNCNNGYITLFSSLTKYKPANKFKL